MRNNLLESSQPRATVPGGLIIEEGLEAIHKKTAINE